MACQKIKKFLLILEENKILKRQAAGSALYFIKEKVFFMVHEEKKFSKEISERYFFIFGEISQEKIENLRAMIGWFF